MDILSILILGLVQGITEWVPISSKSMCSYVYLMMGEDPQNLIYVLLYLHLGTILSAILYFRHHLFELAKQTLALRSVSQFRDSHAGFYICALIGTGVIGLPLLLLQKFVFESLASVETTSLIFLLMGVGLLITSYFLYIQKSKIHEKKIQSANVFDGFFVGLFQGLSVLAGVSRSGTTTTALAILKYEPKAIFELSFILSIPTVICAEILFYFLDINFASFDIVQAILLASSSFVFGYLTIDAIIRFVKKFNLATLAAGFAIVMILTAILGVS
jgi:undecaprenyl-diphosphatase